ncbi:MAG: sterol desaturase family protein [Pseudomonadota bacterium]
MAEFISWTTQLLAAGAEALVSMLADLVWPFMFFTGLALIIRRGKIVDDLRRVLPETSVTFGLMLFNLLITVPALTGAAFVMVWIGSTTLPGFLSTEIWAALPGIVVILTAITIGDFVGYWRNRFEHTRFLWPSHTAHHSDTEITWFALERFHPINRATTYFIDQGLLVLLGFPVEAIIANGFVRHYYGFLIHADLPWTYGPLGRIFVSPAMHRWHHANDPVYFKTNFATVFSLWDQMFGTFRVPGPCTVPLGVSEDMGSGTTGQLLHPFRLRAYRRNDAEAAAYADGNEPLRQ